MAELKTKPTDVPVADFIAAVGDPRRREEAGRVDAMLRAVSGAAPVMWGPSIIGYGCYQSPSGPWPRIGFSPRKAELVMYLLDGYAGKEGQLARLGKCRVGKSCLYIRKLADVDEAVLREMAQASWAYMREKYPA